MSPSSSRTCRTQCGWQNFVIFAFLGELVRNIFRLQGLKVGQNRSTEGAEGTEGAEIRVKHNKFAHAVHEGTNLAQEVQRWYKTCAKCPYRHEAEQKRSKLKVCFEGCQRFRVEFLCKFDGTLNLFPRLKNSP